MSRLAKRTRVEISLAPKYEIVTDDEDQVSIPTSNKGLKSLQIVENLLETVTVATCIYN